MSEHQCNRCGETKAADDMIVRGGKPSSCCRDCFKASFAKGGKRKVRKVKSLEEVVERRAAPKPVKLNGSLEVPSGLGFRASVEDELVCIEQDRPPDDEGVVYTHSLTLAPHEAAQLAGWLAARAQS